MDEHGEQLSIGVERDGDPIVVRVSGELDLTNASDLEQVLSDIDGDVVVDLSELQFMDAQGLAVLAGADRRVRRRGAQLSIVHASSLAQRMFRVTGLEHLLSGSDAL